MVPGGSILQFPTLSVTPLTDSSLNAGSLPFPVSVPGGSQTRHPEALPFPDLVLPVSFYSFYILWGGGHEGLHGKAKPGSVVHRYVRYQKRESSLQKTSPSMVMPNRFRSRKSRNFNCFRAYVRVYSHGNSNVILFPVRKGGGFLQL